MLQKLLLALLVILPGATALAGDATGTRIQPEVLLETTQGDIRLRLFPDKAPKTVANFLQYVETGHYEGTIFHRVIPQFMIQGGGFLPGMVEREPEGETVPNESRNRLHNVRGTVAMARQDDPDSAKAQFFINQRTNLRLDWVPGREGYTVFGEVIEGMDVVDFIATAPTTTVNGHGDVPQEPVIIEHVRLMGEPADGR